VGTEIERKFLVTGQGWRTKGKGTRYRQGYLAAAKHCTVRVRVGGRRAYVTVKGPTKGASRSEYEYEIPVRDAGEMLDALCDGRVIEKTRYEVRFARVMWEIDVFEGHNKGLVLAEVELKRERQRVVLPPWVGKEVTGDVRYYNSYLSRRPYSTWKRR
jgi:CYTH domain-containing protein